MGMYVRHQGSLIQIHTPGKLNLFLEVLGRRKDGFHEIETLMTPISLFDTVELSPSPEAEIRLDCHWATGVAAQAAVSGTGALQVWEPLPCPAENLVVKALERLRQAVGRPLGAMVRLIKRIPAAAGLGGASSDAAAALVAANRLWNLGWSRVRLSEVAAAVGSDVPFFLQAGAAICRGRGEQVEPVHLPPLHVVIARPPGGLSTAEVYRRCRPADRPHRAADLIAAARHGQVAALGARMFNRLQAAAEDLSPWIGRLREAFGQADCWGHQLSGSGSCYFGICRQGRHARRVAGRLRAAGCGAVFQATTLPVAGGQNGGEPV